MDNGFLSARLHAMEDPLQIHLSAGLFGETFRSERI